MAYESLVDRYREVENDINPSQGTSGGGSSTVPLDEQSLCLRLCPVAPI